MADKFTDLFLKSLKPKDKEYTVREKGGFGVRVMPSGRKVFFFIYRVAGKRCFLNLGDYPATKLKDAREEFETAQQKVKALKTGRADGVDPVQLKKETRHKLEEKNNALTVADLIDEYINKHAKPSKKGWEEDQRILNKDALPKWGKHKAADIKKRDVVLLLESIVERGAPGSANNNFKIIRKMFRFAVQRDIIEHSPCDGVVMPAPLNRRERALTESEIKTLWGNLESAKISDDIIRALKMILVTAQRPGEVIGMHTSEIDGNWWTIPAERSKNGKEHRVYLTDTALELIGSMKAIDPKTGEVKKDPKTGKEIDKGYIFPCPLEKKNQPIAVNALAHAVRRNLAAPLTDKKGKPIFNKDGKQATENLLEVEHFTPHDLRRTAATFMSKSGFMDEVIDAVLNHVKQGIIRTYNLNRYDNEKQQALETWSRKLQSIITGKQGNVVSIIRKAV